MDCDAMKERRKICVREIILLVIFGIALPSFDSISDTVLGLKFILNGHKWWGLAVLCPVLANTGLTMSLWYQLEDAKVRNWSWLLVFGQVWPQYKAAKVIVRFWKASRLRAGDQEIDLALRYKDEFNRSISTLEPFVESIPQVLILSDIYFKSSVIGTAMHQTEVTDNMTIMDGGSRWLFYTTFSISTFSATIGITKFFRVGPTHFLPQATHLILGYTSTACFLLFKGVALAILIYSSAAALPALGITRHNNTLLAPSDSQSICPAVTIVKDYGFDWQRYRRFQLKLNNELSSDWNSHPKYTPLGTNWVYFYDDPTKAMICQDTANNRTSSDCMDSRDNCRESKFSSADFYCADMTVMGSTMWLTVMIIPTFCLNSLVMVYTLGPKIFKVWSMWPPFVFSGNFSPFMFGPVKHKSQIYLGISPWLTVVNITMAWGQTTLALILLNKMTDPTTTKHGHSKQAGLSSNENKERNTLTSDVQGALTSLLGLSMAFSLAALGLLLLQRSHSIIGLLGPQEPTKKCLVTSASILKPGSHATDNEGATENSSQVTVVDDEGIESTVLQRLLSRISVSDKKRWFQILSQFRKENIGFVFDFVIYMVCILVVLLITKKQNGVEN